MRISPAKMGLTALGIAALVFVFVWPVVRGRLESQRIDESFAVIQKTVREDTAWRGVRALINVESGSPHFELRGTVGEEAALEKLRGAMETNKIPYPVRWAVVVVTNVVGGGESK